MRSQEPARRARRWLRTWTLAGGLLAAAACQAAPYTFTELGTLGGTSGSATSINTAGQVVGWSQMPDGSQRGFLWQAGTMTNLGTLGGTAGFGNGINAKGVVVGESTRTGDLQSVAGRWSSGQATDLGTLGGDNSQAQGINRRGHIVGASQAPGGSSTAPRCGRASASLT